MTLPLSPPSGLLPADAGAPGNLAAHLAALAERREWNGRVAFHEGHRTWTHGEVHDLAARAATVLADHGVCPGDRVLLALPDSVAWVAAFLAIARLGAVAVLADPDLTPPELGALTEDTGAVLCVTAPGPDRRHPRRGRLSADLLLALTRTSGPTTEAHPTDARTPLYIQYTAGTTGRPKAVVHAHGDPRTYFDLVGRRLLRIVPDDVTLSVPRLYGAHGFGNTFVFPLFSGSSAVLTGHRPGSADVDALVVRHRVTLLYSVPSAYTALLAGLGEGHEACFASVRAAVSAGERLPDGLGRRITSLLGAPVLEQIGCAETGHAFCANSFDHNHPGTVGRPVPGYEVEVRDRDGSPVPDGEDGELWVRGPTVAPASPDRPGENTRDLAGGWLPTGDLARREPDGTIRHLGRRDETETVEGATVSPLGTEAVLRAHPAVREAAVAAVTDERGTGRLRAFVVPVVPIPVGLEAELICLARDRLTPDEVPHSVSFVPTLPRTRSGGLRRHLVRQGAW